LLEQLSVDHFLSNLAVEPQELLFHYTGRCTLQKILTSGNIRMNTLDKMNDPRERKDWIARQLVMHEGGVSQESLMQQDEVLAQPNVLLRRGARIACFTEERHPLPDADPDSLFHRGWARARMWLQYAEDHKGACVVFDYRLLADSLDKARRLEDGDVFSISPMKYVDKPLHIALQGSFATKAEIQDALYELTDDGRNIADLFFTKNTDWQSEEEVRVLALLWKWSEEVAGPLDLPYGDSLRAVVLGEDFGTPDWLHQALKSRSLPEEDVLRASWVDGAPILKPFEEQTRRIA
jgi:hypothetical protein